MEDAHEEGEPMCLAREIASVVAVGLLSARAESQGAVGVSG